MGCLGLKEENGAVRVSLAHYNTIAEIERFGRVLEKMPAADPVAARNSVPHAGSAPDVEGS